MPTVLTPALQCHALKSLIIHFNHSLSLLLPNIPFHFHTDISRTFLFHSFTLPLPLSLSYFLYVTYFLFKSWSFHVLTSVTLFSSFSFTPAYSWSYEETVKHVIRLDSCVTKAVTLKCSRITAHNFAIYHGMSLKFKIIYVDCCFWFPTLLPNVILSMARTDLSIRIQLHYKNLSYT